MLSAHGIAPSDAELIAAARDGSREAHAELYLRHRDAAYRLARMTGRPADEVEKLVKAGFARVLEAIRSGGGPEWAFRAYLLAAIAAPHEHGLAGRSISARAFATLPQRWQTALWHHDIEREPAPAVARLLGLRPAETLELTRQARAALLQAYVKVHLRDRTLARPRGRELRRCQAASTRLGAWASAGLPKREIAQLERHLDRCRRCRLLAAELSDLDGGLRVLVAYLVLGPAAPDYLDHRGAPPNLMPAWSANLSRRLLTFGTAATVLIAALVAGLLTGPTPAQEAARRAVVSPAIDPFRPLPLELTPPVAEDPAANLPTQQPGAQQPAAQQVHSAPAAQAPQQPQPQQPAPQQAQPPAPQPVPQASLQVLAHRRQVELDAGGATATMPISVRNGGNAASSPVTLTLAVPPGVAVSGPNCAGTAATVSCAVAGLQPGATVSFPFTVRAVIGARSGPVTGQLGGGTVNVPMRPVDVVVRPAPDSLYLRAWWLDALHVQVINTGRTSGLVTVRVALPPHVYSDRPTAGCTGSRGVVACKANLGPQQQAGWRLSLATLAQVSATVAVYATLGDSTRAAAVPIRLTGLQALEQ